jgi:dipeptidyl aminopeptidase/acylaminoacyl peptidase
MQPTPAVSSSPQPSARALADLEPFFAAPTVSSPVWLAGDRIAFISDRSGVPQVWVTEPISNEIADPDLGVPVHQLTEVPDRISALTATPDGEAIIFGMDNGGDEHQQLWLMAVPAGDPATAGTLVALTDDPGVIHSFGAMAPAGDRFAFADNERDNRFFDVRVIGLGDPASIPILQMVRDAALYPVAYSPDGGHLLIRQNTTNLDHDLYLHDPDSHEPRLLTAHEGEASIAAATFAPGGDSVLVATNRDREFAALVRISLDGETLDVLAEPDWDVELVEASQESGIVAYSVNEDGISRLRLRWNDATEVGIDELPAGTIEKMTWSPSGAMLAVSITSPVASGAVWLVRPDGTASPVVPASYGDLDPAALIDPEIVRFVSFDGREVPAFWFVPEGDGPFPVVVDVHGGPEGQRRAAWQPVLQFLVSRGFAVLSTNVRGSTGYGKRYSHLDDVELRYDAVADLGAAHDWLREQPNVIADQIGIYGVSYGGFMVLAALTTQPERWAAGVDVVGVANFVSFFENTGPWRRRLRAAEYGDPDTQAELLRELSPIHRVANIRAPLFVIHGRNDPRVPVGETEQIVSAVRGHGGVAEIAIYDDEGHGLIKRKNRVHGYGLMADFLERYLADRIIDPAESNTR